MTNFDKWQLYMKDFISPQSFVDFSFYYMIGAALQRRVWTGPEHSPLYPNMYIILVGEPGIGKGLVVKQIAEILRHHKLENPHKLNTEPDLSTPEKANEYATKVADYNKAPKSDIDQPLLIPVAADASTYEALVRKSSQSTRRINYPKWDEKLQKHTSGIYVHSSLCFCLEEISSLFRKKTEDLVNYLLHAFDCGDYEYETIGRGTDKVRKCCLSFFGGTTPSFMQSTFNDKLLNEGFSSRTIFIVANANRHNKLFIPQLSPEQVEARNDIITHIGKLTKLYGHCKLEPDAVKFMEHWWEVEHQTRRPNTSLKLASYYARKNIHALKLATAVHFGEDAEMDGSGRPKNMITVAECQVALAMLAQVEQTMHFALGFDSQNPLSAPSKKIKEYVTKTGPYCFNELFIEFNQLVRKSELEEILVYLTTTSQLHIISCKDAVTDKHVVVYHTEKTLSPENRRKTKYKP